MSSRGVPTCCCVPGCSGKAYHSRYCDKHQDVKSQNNLKESNPKQYEHNRFYDTARWQRARTHQLAIEPMCRVCKQALAEEVDHIIPRSKGGADVAQDNLQSLCTKCHSAKTNKERKGIGGSNT